MQGLIFLILFVSPKKRPISKTNYCLIDVRSLKLTEMIQMVNSWICWSWSKNILKNFHGITRTIEYRIDETLNDLLLGWPTWYRIISIPTGSIFKARRDTTTVSARRVQACRGERWWLLPWLLLLTRRFLHSPSTHVEYRTNCGDAIDEEDDSKTIMEDIVGMKFTTTLNVA